MHGDDPFQRRWARYLLAAAVGVIALIALIAVYGYVTGAPWVGMVEYTYDAGWRVTSTDGYKTFWDWLALLIVPLVLAFGGSLVAIFVTHELEDRRDKAAWSMRIAEDYLRRFDEHGRVKANLKSKDTKLSGAQEFNVLAWGNWLEFVALLCDQNMAETRLIRELGIDRFILEFYDAAASHDQFKDKFKEDWRYIEKFSMGGK